MTVIPLTHGMSEITVVTTAINAAATSARVTALAHSVCEDDPRTLAERRADAHDAAIQGADRLSCRCGLPHCPAGGVVVGPVVVNVLADSASLTQPLPQTPEPSPPAPDDPDTRSTTSPKVTTRQSTSTTPMHPNPLSAARSEQSCPATTGCSHPS